MIIKIISTSSLLLGCMAQFSIASEIVHFEDQYHLTKAQVLDLKEISIGRTLQISVAYPGKTLTDICSLELRTGTPLNTGIKVLLKRVSIVRTIKESPVKYSVINGSLIIPLTENRYVDGVKLISKSGEPIDKIISESLGNEDFIAIPERCK